MECFCNIVGKPITSITDMGKEFDNTILYEFLSKNEIYHYIISRENHRANDGFEQLRGILTIISNKYNHWNYFDLAMSY